MNRPNTTSLVLAAVITAVSSYVASPGAAQLAPPNAAGVTWGHIHLNVRDVEAHTRIWTEHFGGQVVAFDAVRTIRLPNTVLMLYEEAPTGPSRGSSLDHFGFSVPDVEAFLRSWRTAGLEVEAEFRGTGDRPQAYLRLPDGIRVELEEVESLSLPAIPYHVHVYTDGDPEALRDRFVQLFGLRPRERGTIPFTADVPGMNISFSASPEPVAATRGRAVDHVGLEIDDLEAYTDRLTEQGVAFDVEYRELEGLDIAIAFFTDASGTYWELTEGLDALAADGQESPGR